MREGLADIDKFLVRESLEDIKAWRGHGATGAVQYVDKLLLGVGFPMKKVKKTWTTSRSSKRFVSVPNVDKAS